MQIGKVSFSDDQIRENLAAAMDALVKAKPASAKGKYVQSITISATMGPGVPVDTASAVKV
jgi:large subunit ribosomal protein L1